VRPVLTLLLLLFAFNDASAQQPQIERIDLIDFGIYTLDRKNDESVRTPIPHYVNSNVRLAATIRTIPARVGVTFGFSYKVIAKANRGSIDLRKVIKFPDPGLVPPASTKPILQLERGLKVNVGEVVNTTYTFDRASELVPGTWTIELWSGDRKLITQGFSVQNP
jgi:Domain of unknown function (DUF3859)